jgi:hypothetical protein
VQSTAAGGSCGWRLAFAASRTAIVDSGGVCDEVEIMFPGSGSIRSFRVLLVAVGIPLIPSVLSAEGSAPNPREFADRWVACIGSGKSGLADLFVKDAVLSWESMNRICKVGPAEYESLLRETRKRFKGFSRERGEVEWSGEEAKGFLLSFTVIDRIETPDGFVIRTESVEEFAFSPDDPSRAITYTYHPGSLETVKAPEDWVRYAGPISLNAHIAQTLFFRPPQGMVLWLAGGAVALAALLKALHSLGIKRRF